MDALSESYQLQMRELVQKALDDGVVLTAERVVSLYDFGVNPLEPDKGRIIRVHRWTRVEARKVVPR